MSEFEPAVELVLKNEGGLEDDASDPGGLTNKGISLRFLMNVPNNHMRSYGLNYNDLEHLKELLRALTIDQAKAIYKGEFWNAALFHQINNQRICNYIFDTAVNMGISVAIKVSQRAVNSVNGNTDCVCDGILGSKTLDEINHAGYILLAALRSERADEYRIIARDNPKIAKDLEGWLRRAYSS